MLSTSLADTCAAFAARDAIGSGVGPSLFSPVSRQASSDARSGIGITSLQFGPASLQLSTDARNGIGKWSRQPSSDARSGIGGGSRQASSDARSGIGEGSRQLISDARSGIGIGSSAFGPASRQLSCDARSGVGIGSSAFGPASRQLSSDARSGIGIGSSAFGPASRQLSSDARSRNCVHNNVGAAHEELSSDTSCRSSGALSTTASQPLPSMFRPGYAGTSSLGSDDGDTLSSVSTARPMGMASEPRLSVNSLRDQLVRRARDERQRCFDIAEAAERRRTELCRSVHASTQTDEVLIMDSFGASPRAMPTSSESTTWANSDDAAQAEALETLKMLGARGSPSKESPGGVSQLEADLRAERAAREEFKAQAALERSRKEAAQQQVFCLENELDGKEAALQLAERVIEQRNADLEEAQWQIRQLQEALDRSNSSAAALAHDESVCRTLTAQVVELQRMLQQKDQRQAQVLSVLRQPGSIGLDNDPGRVRTRDQYDIARARC